MKLTFKTFILSISLLSFLASCNQDLEELDKTVDLKSVDISTLNDSILTGDDEILPYEGNREDLPQRVGLMASSNDIYNELYEIRELPVYLEVVENSLGSGNRYLRTNGKGKEISLASYSNKNELKYYIKILPASTGIPYLIYSYKENTPISIGSYSSNPNVRVLYTRKDASGSLFGASWDFLSGTKTPNTLVIENQDIVEQGGGGYWDIYYNVIGVKQNKVYFDKYHNLASQEFIITPAEDFKVLSIEYINDASATLTQLPSSIKKDGYANYGHIDQQKEFTITQVKESTSSFTKMSSTKIEVSTEFKTKVPFIAEGKISTKITQGLEFTWNESEKRSETVTHKYPVVIPAGYRADLTLTFFNYEIDMDYIAHCRGLTSGREVTIKGRWNGVSVEETEATLTLTNLSNPKEIKSFKVSPSKLFNLQEHGL